ncbi:MAG: DMT family transporter [Ruminococcaceae bacterium]|nr:DMT family transporter [Oscillospiraceae bacterium]
MGYIYVIITTIMFSLIGTCVTLAKTWVSSDVISFARFFFGVIFLLAFMLITKKKVSLRFTGSAIWLGVICKCVNYLTENYAISMGYSFGSIIGWPVQCVAILLFSIFFLKEKLTKTAVAGVILCVTGVIVISLNGQSVGQFFTGDGLISLVLFVIAGTGAAGFTVAQKMLLDKMDSCNLNLSMFALCACITAAPLPITAEFTGEFSFSALFGLMMLGMVTCAAFLLSAEAMKTIPVFIVTVIQSMSVILTLIWAVLFFNEPVTAWIISGTLIFLCGMILVNKKKKKA